jgi:hypothetical protein
MAATLTAYIPNSKITVVTTTALAPFGFIDTTSYLTRIKVEEYPGPPPPPPPEVVLTLGSGFIVGQLKKIKLVEIVNPVLNAQVVVTSQHFLDGPNQTIVFTLVGDTAELMWTRNGWRIISTSDITGNDLTPEISSLN